MQLAAILETYKPAIACLFPHHTKHSLLTTSRLYNNNKNLKEKASIFCEKPMVI